MEQVVTMVVEKTGISEEHARTAVDTVVNYLKKQLPEPVAGQIDSAINGGGAEGGSGGVADMAKKASGMFGK